MIEGTVRHRNPEQPRKDFDPASLENLAASIKRHGLMQPITVRRDGRGFVIVAGERRYRAHKIASLSTIQAHVVDLNPEKADEQAIIENLQRADLTPLEEARAYQKMMDDHGYTLEELVRRLGLRQAWRITERTRLLRLDPDYQDLLAKGQITPSQGTEMARLSPRGQRALFQAIRTGQCANYQALRAVATALVEAEAQAALFDAVEAPTADEKDIRRASRFERKIEQVARLLAEGIKDNEIVAVHKVNPTNAATLADKIAAMQKSLKDIELALRQAGAQASFAKNAASGGE